MMTQANAAIAKGNILVVDDTPANLKLLTDVLADRGYTVRPVLEGPTAVSAAQKAPPDLILLDIVMPKMNGYEVCEKLKADDKTRDIPIIFISALDATEDKLNAFRVGGVDYVTKPFQVEEVLARVETHLALRNLHKQLKEHSEKMARELELAGEIQASFLPREFPSLPGWELSAGLVPASETSGDFFDFICLPNDHIAFLIADVVDKGVGAALFMAFSWTLIRTYAAEFPDEPSRVFDAVNRRILEDTKSNQFVTAFYGILDPSTGHMLYCNAGHCAPFALRSKKGDISNSMARTGMPLGIAEDETWESRSFQMDPGDSLVLYTDGITEAVNRHGVMFGKEGLIETIGHHSTSSADDLKEAIISDLRRFIAEAPLMDDIALSILIREAE